MMAEIYYYGSDPSRTSRARHEDTILSKLRRVAVVCSAWDMLVCGTRAWGATRLLVLVYPAATPPDDGQRYNYYGSDVALEAAPRVWIPYNPNIGGKMWCLLVRFVCLLARSCRVYADVPAGTLCSLQVTFIIYLAALMSFVGWFIFSIYVGIGFIALPIDCFNAFRYRPKVMSSSELTAARKALRTRSTELERLGSDMFKEQRTFHDAVHSRSERRKHTRSAAQELNRYRVLVDMLEHDLEKFQLGDPAYYAAHFNPLWPFAKLIFGVISVVLTLAWIIHIIIYMLFDPPVRTVHPPPL